MTDQFNKDRDEKQGFVREQIKEKPINRKKLYRKLLESVLSGFVFAVTAGLVFFVMSPLWSRNPEPEQVILIGSNTESESEPVTEETETEGPADNVIIENVTLTLDDYQKLQNELYNIGRQANRSVVSITSVVKTTDWFDNTYERENTGAGMIIAENRSEVLILTSKKAIPGKDSILVTFANDLTAEARVKGCDENTGIVVLSVDKEKLDETTASYIRIAPVNTAGYVRNGQLTIAVGSPDGTPFSIMTGAVISRDNDATRMDNNFNILTTDVPGDKTSTGVLINTKGEIIGLIMQDYNGAGIYSHLTAVNILDVADIADLLISGRSVPYLGISVTTVTEKISKANGIPTGIYVRDVAMDSPAMAGGLQRGDVITRINDVAVAMEDSLYRELLKLEPGTKTKITLQRQSGDAYSEVTCNVTIGELAVE